MKGSRLFAIFTAAVCAALFTCAVHAEDKPLYDESSVIVITKPSSAFSLFSVRKSYESVFEELGITEIETVASIGAENAYSGMRLFSASAPSESQILKLTLPEAGKENVQNAIDAINSSGTVSSAQPNYYYYLDTDYTNKDPYYPTSQGGLKKVNAEDVWDYDISCENITIAIIDSGLMRGHEDLEDNIWENPGEIPDNGKDDDNNGYIDDVHGWDFTVGGANTKNTDPTDPIDPYFPERANEGNYDQGHGTHVAGIASGVTGNGLGVASLARDAKLIGLRAYDDEKEATTDNLCKAIAYAGMMKFDIVNCSWGMKPEGLADADDVALKAAIKSCPDTMFVCAAGNNGANNDLLRISPASYGFDNTISVASSNIDDTLSPFSNYGENVEIAAPGNYIYSTANTYLSGNLYEIKGGTSQATPLVASAAAVLKARYPDLTPAEIKKYLLNGARIAEGLCYTDAQGNEHRINGNRRLNAAGAIRLADNELLHKATAPEISVKELEIGKEITITTLTEGAAIYYTDNGGTPTEEDYLYEGPFVIYEDTSISAIAVKDGYNDSDITYLDVEVTEPDVASPVITIASNTAGSWITITSNTAGATIYYSTENNILFNPIEYKGPFRIDDTTTVQAYAVKEHMADSGTSEMTFNFVKKPVISVTDVEGGKQVEITSETKNAIIYYTTDGTTPTAESDIYTAPFKVTTDMTVKALATRYDMYAATAVSEEITVTDTAAPVFSEESAGAEYAASLSITSETDGAKIYYTTDGTDPTSENALYTEPLKLNETTTIKAVAMKDGSRISDITDYTVSIAGKPRITSEQTAQGARVTIASETDGAKIYYTTDGSTPTAESVLYAEPFIIPETAQIRAIAAKDGLVSSTAAIKTVEVKTVAPPVISPADGTVAYGTAVNMRCSEDGAEIHYTIDGTDPTEESPIYTQQLALTENGSVTVKAIAVKDGFKSSGIVEAQYEVLPLVKNVVKLNVGSAQTSGESVSVPVAMISGGEDITSFNLEIAYDKTSLLCQSYEIANGLNEDDFSISEINGVLSVDYNGDAVSDGTIFTLVFALQPNITDGDYDITISNPETIVFNNSDIYEADVTNGKVTVNLPPPDTNILKTRVTLTNENGEDVFAGDYPQEIHTSVVFTNADLEIPPEEAEDLKDFRVIIAVYNDRGILAGISIKEASDKELSKELSDTITLPQGTQVDTVKMFIWSGLETIRPLRDTKILIGE